MMLLIPLYALVGGLAGGEEKRGEERRVFGRCDESHESAEGSSIIMVGEMDRLE